MTKSIDLQTNGFPAVMGVEEETGLMVNYGSGWQDPTDIAERLGQYLPQDLAHAGQNGRFFLQNGGLVYAGGCRDSTVDNVERTTPECLFPEQAGVYLQACEDLIVDIARLYVEEMSHKVDGLTKVRIQRRVVDSAGNRKGCHDNFSVNSPADYTKGVKYHALIAHLATRSFMTGAGFVANNGFRHAQKMDGLQNVVGYGNAGYMFRPVGEDTRWDDSTGNRLEIRCSDINISPWAVRVRLGGVALLMASLELPLKDEISRILFDTSLPDRSSLALNAVPISLDGIFIFEPTNQSYQPIDFQERLADIYLKLSDYIEVPDEYIAIARELKLYCQDYRKVLANEETINLLADRSDMAAKFTIIIDKLRKNPNEGKTATLAAGLDLFYDYIGVQANPSQEPLVKRGYGYALRDAGRFKYRVDKRDVQDAYRNPPVGTRAFARGTLIRDNMLAEVDWSRAKVPFSNPDKKPSGDIHTVALSDPANPKIDARSQRLIRERGLGRSSMAL